MKRVNLNSIEFDGEIVALNTYGDGNCYFHSILGAFCKKYIISNSYEQKLTYVSKLRYVLSNQLNSPYPGTSLKYYDVISNGSLRENSEFITECSLEYMMRELNSNNPVGNIYQELISDCLNIDIYLIDITKGDIYFTACDYNNLYKNRNSIVIGYNDYCNDKIINHYETIAVISDLGIPQTFFTFDHPFIQKLKDRIRNRVL